MATTIAPVAANRAGGGVRALWPRSLPYEPIFAAQVSPSTFCGGRW